MTALLAEGRPPPVILIQADEGPIPAPAPSVPWQDATDEELRIKFGILNAFYFPDGDYRRLRQDITPVNSYRVLVRDALRPRSSGPSGPDARFPGRPAASTSSTT